MIKKIIVTMLLVSSIYANVEFNLLRYSYIGDTKKLKETLKQNPNINTKDDEEMTPLLYAAFHNNFDSLKLLVENGADVNSKSYSGRNALVYAFSNKNVEMVKYLLAKGIKPIIYDETQDILYNGVLSGVPELVEIALKYTKDINAFYTLNSRSFQARERLKTTLLIQASSRKSLEIVKLLLKNGADINKANERGETPIMSALREKKFKIANFLLKKGANLDVEDVMGNTPLSYAINLKQTNIALKMIEKVNLKKYFTRDSVRDKHTWRYRDEWEIRLWGDEKYIYNYLHIAAINNNSKIIKALLSHGLNIDEKSRFKRNPLPALALAIKLGHYGAYKILKESGATLYERYRSSGQGDAGLMYFAGSGSFYTPLSYALTGDSQNIKIIEDILSLQEFSNFIKLENSPFYQMLLVLESTNNSKKEYAKEILKRFRNGGYRESSRDKELKHRIKNKAPKKEKPKSNYYKISTALNNGDITAIKELQAKGVDILSIYKDAPYSAIVDGHPEIVLELIDLGYSINSVREYSGENMLHRLSKQTNINLQDKKIQTLFLELIKKGIDINHADKDGMTPLFYMLRWTNATDEFISKFISLGANFGDDSRVLVELYKLKRFSKFSKIINNSSLSKNIDSLYKNADLTEVVLESLKSSKTPLSITKHLFQTVYEKNLYIDYKAVFKLAKKKKIYNAIRAITFYSGIEGLRWKKVAVEKYEYLLRKGLIKQALDFYLNNAKEVNYVSLHHSSKAPLSVAIEHNKTEYYAKIIKAGAIIDDRGHRNVDMLIGRNDLKHIQLFAKMGMDINHVDYSGNSYFFRTLHHSEKNTFLAKEILKLGYKLENPNLDKIRIKSDINLAYRVALEKKDTELADMVRELTDNSVMEVRENEVVEKNGKIYFKGSNKLFTGKVKGEYNLLSKTTSYRDGVRDGQTIVSKQNDEIFAVTYYIDGQLQSGILVQNANTHHMTICKFNDDGTLNGCKEKNSQNSKNNKLTNNKVADILREI